MSEKEAVETRWRGVVDTVEVALMPVLLGDGIRDTLDPRMSPAFLRLVTGAGRASAARPGGAPGLTTLTPRKETS